MSARTSFGLDFQSSRTLSLAQSGRGGALLTDTITLNPSLLGFQPITAISGTFSWFNNPNASDGSVAKLYNVGIIDGKNQYVNAGLSFTRNPDLDFIHVSVAKRVLDWMSVGLLVKRFNTNSNSSIANGAAASGFDGGLSASFAIPPELLPTPVQFGLTSDNLMHQKADEPYLGPRQFGFGTKVNLKEILMLYGDFAENFASTGAYPTYSGAAEVSLGADFYIRGGLMGFRQTGFGLGGGWVGPRVGIAYGYQARNSIERHSYQHAVTLDFFM